MASNNRFEHQGIEYVIGSAAHRTLARTNRQVRDRIAWPVYYFRGNFYSKGAPLSATYSTYLNRIRTQAHAPPPGYRFIYGDANQVPAYIRSRPTYPLLPISGGITAELTNDTSFLFTSQYIYSLGSQLSRNQISTIPLSAAGNVSVSAVRRTYRLPQSVMPTLQVIRTAVPSQLRSIRETQKQQFVQWLQTRVNGMAFFIGQRRFQIQLATTSMADGSNLILNSRGTFSRLNGPSQGTFRNMNPIAQVTRILDDYFNLYRGFNDHQFRCDEVIIRILSIPAGFGRGAHRSFQRAFKTWIVISDHTLLNCLWVSLYTSMAWARGNPDVLWNKRKRHDGGAQLKYRVKASDDFGYSTFQSIQQFVDSTQKSPWYGVRVYNNLFELQAEFVPKGVEAAKFQTQYGVEPSETSARAKVYRWLELLWFDSGHYAALIRKTNLRRVLTEFDMTMLKQSIPSIIERDIPDDDPAGDDLDDYVPQTWRDLLMADTIDREEDRADYEEFLVPAFQSMREHQALDTDSYDASAQVDRKDELFVIEPKKHVPTEYNSSMYVAWDCETTIDPADNSQKPYAVGLAYQRNGETVYESFWGLDCMIQFLRYIHEHRSELSGSCFYAHNGGRFDLPILLRFALMDPLCKWRIVPNSVVELNGGFLSMQLNYVESDNLVLTKRRQYRNSECDVMFRDSYRVLPQSLEKLCKEFKVAHQKLTELVSHDEINLSNWQLMRHKFPLDRYLEHDCKGLLEVLLMFSKDVKDQYELDLFRCYTGATLSKRVFFQQYYSPDTTPIYHLPTHMDQFIRQSYLGGRVELFAIGKLPPDHRYYYYDFTSLYPWAGTKPIPYGLPERMETDAFRGAFVAMRGDGEEFLKPGFHGFVRVQVVTTDATVLPLHGYRYQDKLVFPVFQIPTELVLFADEIYKGQSLHCYSYKFLDAIRFPAQEPILKDFFEKMVEAKQTHRAAGRNALSFSCKIIANSGYGFWGIRTADRDGFRVLPNQDISWYDDLINNRLVSLCRFPNYTFCRVLHDLSIYDHNVGIASAITSWSRMRLYELLRALQLAEPENPLAICYCDTDSVITSVNLQDHPQLIQEFQLDPATQTVSRGGALGTLKCEVDELVHSKLSSIEAAEQLRHDGGAEFCLDTVILVAAKGYSCSKTLYTGETVSINKLKGFKQLKGVSKKPTGSDGDDPTMLDVLQSEDFARLVEGEALFQNMRRQRCDDEGESDSEDDGDAWANPCFLKQNQTQFVCPRSNFVRDRMADDGADEAPQHFQVGVRKVVKRFRMIYTKGEWSLPPLWGTESTQGEDTEESYIPMFSIVSPLRV